MSGSQQGALIEGTRVLAELRDERLTLPESTMVIVACSGALWALVYGAVNAFLG